MEKALLAANRSPIWEVCRWNSGLKSRKSFLLGGEEPEPGRPVVFHLHGHIDDFDSFVLTEDDYLDFMVNARRYESVQATEVQVIPPKVNELISTTSLLFLGYGLRDWNLRVLLRALIQSADVAAQKTSAASSSSLATPSSKRSAGATKPLNPRRLLQRNEDPGVLGNSRGVSCRTQNAPGRCTPQPRRSWLARMSGVTEQARSSPTPVLGLSGQTRPLCSSAAIASVRSCARSFSLIHSSLSTDNRVPARRHCFVPDWARRSRRGR